MNTYSYDFINNYNGHIKPSEVHTARNYTTSYFRKYLLQKIISVYKFDNIPEHWSVDYFLYNLFIWGFVVVLKTDKFDVIPQGGLNASLFGYDVFYRPTQAVITNPLLSGITEPRIGVECSLIKLQPNYSGVMDIVDYYAELLSLATESLEANLINSKLAYVFACENKTVAESFKKMVDEINQGKPSVFADKKLFSEDGSPLWDNFQNNLKQNYIAKEILEDMAKIDARFCTDIGIPNVNIAKESGVTSDEVQANNIDTRSKANLWLETLKHGLDDTNKMFGLNLTVDFREDITSILVDNNVENEV